MDATWLLVLVCPIGMGLMMWFMAKGMRSSRDEHGAASGSTGELDGRSIGDLRDEHERLAGEIERLERREHAPH